MHPLERWCVQVRHSAALKEAEWLWDLLRPGYDLAVTLTACRGVERMMNGVDSIRLHPRCRGITETYEPEVWERLMAEVHPGDTVADVGANIGLYTIALAQRVGSAGRVVAFEPDLANATLLRRNLALNPTGAKVEVIEAAVGNEEGEIPFEMNGEVQSHVSTHPDDRAKLVRSVTLDKVFENEPLGLLKVDVEGFEEKVLQGGAHLLKDPSRKPRRIFVEVHPYAWASLGTTAKSLMDLLKECGYRLADLQGKEVVQLDTWGEIIAYRGDG